MSQVPTPAPPMAVPSVVADVLPHEPEPSPAGAKPEFLRRPRGLLPQQERAVNEPGAEVCAEPPGHGTWYSIGVTSRMTGVELDTLRMWERRYGFPRPVRASSGARLYSDEDVESLKLIRRALEVGYRPGAVVGKSREELVQLIVAAAQAPALTAAHLPSTAALLEAIVSEDVVALRARLHQAAVTLGPHRFLVELAHPTSLGVGELWAAGKLQVRHEHLWSACLSTQLHVLMSACQVPPTAPRVLLATLPHERHGLGLEMTGLYLAARQVAAISLGVDTPAEQIVQAAHSHVTTAVGVLVTHASDLQATARQLRWMLAELPRRVELWIGGAAGPGLGLSDPSVRIVSTWVDLDAAIDSLVGRRA